MSPHETLKLGTLKLSTLAFLTALAASASAAPVESLQKALAQPDQVTELNLGAEDQALTELPATIAKLTNLKILRISCLEKLQSLPEEIGTLKNLEVLSFDNGNGCASNVALPQGIGALANLKELTLFGAMDPTAPAGGAVKPMPASLSKLTGLQKLSLGRNGFTQVPAGVGSLSGLKSLDLQYNRLKEVPASVAGLKGLEQLNLTGNSVRTLPPAFAAAKGIKVTMGNNGLKKADQEALKKNFPGLLFSFVNDMDDDAANEGQ